MIAGWPASICAAICPASSDPECCVHFMFFRRNGGRGCGARGGGDDEIGDAMGEREGQDERHDESGRDRLQHDL